MISSDFLNQYTQLAGQQARDPRGKVSAEVERINTILQKPTGSVREAIAALGEIQSKLSRARACQSLSKNIRPLIREELAKLSSIQEVSEGAISPEAGVERKRTAEEAAVGLPEKVRRVEEPQYPLLVINIYKSAFADTPTKSFSEENIEKFYKEVSEKATRYLERQITQEDLEGTGLTIDQLKSQLLEKIQHDKEKDLEILRLLAQEKEHTSLNTDFFSPSIGVPWEMSRELIKDQIAFIRYAEKRLPLEPPEISDSASSASSKARELIFQNFGPEIMKLYKSLKSNPEAENCWEDIKAFLSLCINSSASDEKPNLQDSVDFLKSFIKNADSLIPRWQTIGKNVFQKTMSELQEPVHSAVLSFLQKDLSRYMMFSSMGLNPLLIISAEQNELHDLLREGISSEVLNQLFLQCITFSEPEVRTIYREVLASYKLLKARGCDDQTSSMIVYQALYGRNFANFPKKIQQMSQESLQAFIEYKDNREGQRFLLNGGAPYLLEQMKAHNLGLTIYCTEKKFIHFFSDKKNVDRFFDRFDGLISSTSKPHIESLLGDIKTLEFVMRVIDPYLADQPIDDQKDKLKGAIRVYTALKINSWDNVTDSDIYEAAPNLTVDERQRVLQQDNDIDIDNQYLAEAFSMFEQTIDTLPLDQVATEPLIRFLASMTFQEAKTWLEKTLPDGKSRLQTLSEDQRIRILCSFPRFESKLPLKPWLELLGVSEQQAKDIVEDATSDVSLQNPLSELKDIDSNDPLTALIQAMDKFNATVAPGVVYMLLSARVATRTCAGQPFLTWGSADPASSLCVASDSAPLHTSAGSVYPRGAFTNLFCSFPAITLRKKIIENANKDPNWIDSLVNALEEEDPEQSPDEEIYYEIQRISRQLLEVNPGLSMDGDTDTVYHRFMSIRSHEEAPPEVEMTPAVPEEEAEMTPVEAQEEAQTSPMEEAPEFQFSEQTLHELEHRFLTSTAFKKDEYFRTLLKDVFRIIQKTPGLEEKIDLENLAHVHGLVFMSLFLLARHAKLTSQPGKLDVALSPFVRFPLKYLDPQPQVRQEDNPGIEPEQFWSFKSDYPFHSLTPLTPNLNFPPQTFQSFAESIQKLSPEKFHALCAACLSPQILGIDSDSALDDPRASRFLEALETADPSVKEVLKEDAKLWINNISTTYVPTMPKKPIPLIAGNKIPFYRDGVADYTPAEVVPDAALPAGNYASALLSKGLKAHDTRLHDGSCGINAFLLGYRGLDLEDEEKVPLETLRKEAQDFRNKVVAYARKHKAELEKKFPKHMELIGGEMQEVDEVQELIDGYKDMDNPQWTSSLVWECAANIYKRPIVVYGCPANPGDTFSIGKDGEVEPSAIFSPKVTSKKPPVKLMFLGMHYLELEGEKD